MTETELAIASAPGVVTELEQRAAIHLQWMAEHPDESKVTRATRSGMAVAYQEAAKLIRESCPPIEPSWEERKAFLDELQRMDMACEDCDGRGVRPVRVSFGDAGVVDGERTCGCRQ